MASLQSTSITGSLYNSGSVTIEGSGSTVFSVDGSSGRLFSITDDLSDSLFSANTIAGLPVLEVFSDNTVKIGTFNDEAIIVNGNTAEITGSVFGTSSYSGNSDLLDGQEGSYYLDFNNHTNKPTLISGSAEGDNQGQIKLNGQNVNTNNLGTDDSPSFAGLTVDTNTLYVDSSNNRVGIGTATPGGILDVWGDENSNSILKITGSPNNIDDLILLGDVDDVGNSQLFTIDGSTPKFTFTGGNVGIGTITPSKTLTVSGDISASGDLFVDDFARIDSLRVGTTSTDPGDGNLYVENNVTILNEITAGSAPGDTHKFEGHLLYNVSTLPTTVSTTPQIFNMDGGGQDSYGIFSRDGSTGGWLGFFAGTADAVMYYKSTGNFRIGSSTSNGGSGFSEHFRITGGGNVGIGTTSPGQKLTVNGNIDSTGNLTLDGNLTIDGEATLGNAITDTHKIDGEILTNYNTRVSTVTTSKQFAFDGGGNDAYGIFTKNGNSNGWLTFFAGTTGAGMLYPSSDAIRWYTSTNAGGTGVSLKMTLNGSGDLDVTGTLSKGAGSFKIDHPNPEKPDKTLWHSFVESPTAGDNIYRWQVEVKGNSHQIELPDYYKYLNENHQIWISPVKHFGQGYGEVNEDETFIEITTNQDGIYNVLLIGTRKDEVAKRAWKGTEREKVNNTDDSFDFT